MANAARKFFATSRVYRIGSDEFVILTPNAVSYTHLDVYKRQPFSHQSVRVVLSWVPG